MDEKLKLEAAVTTYTLSPGEVTAILRAAVDIPEDADIRFILESRCKGFGADEHEETAVIGVDITVRRKAKAGTRNA